MQIEVDLKRLHLSEHGIFRMASGSLYEVSEKGIEGMFLSHNRAKLLKTFPRIGILQGSSQRTRNNKPIHLLHFLEIALIDPFALLGREIP